MPAANDRLRRAINELGLKQTHLSSILGIRPDTLSTMKTGRRPVSASVAIGLERHYGIRAEWIMSGTGTQYVKPSHNPEKPTRAVLTRIVYDCPTCRAELRPEAEVCPFCGCLLIWPHQASRP